VPSQQYFYASYNSTPKFANHISSIFQYATISLEKSPIASDTINKICSFCRVSFAQAMNWQRLRYYCMKETKIFHRVCGIGLCLGLEREKHACREQDLLSDQLSKLVIKCYNNHLIELHLLVMEKNCDQRDCSNLAPWIVLKSYLSELVSKCCIYASTWILDNLWLNPLFFIMRKTLQGWKNTIFKC
jgi:hypothetical protein